MATEIRKPTTYTDPTNDFTLHAQAYDNASVGGDETTNASCYNHATSDPSCYWYGFSAAGQTYTALTLYIKWSTSGGFTDDAFGFEYSINGGGAYSELLPLAVHNDTAIQTTSVALSASQDLTQVYVRARLNRTGGGDKDYIYLWDIWTAGTYSSRRVFHIV